jgi:hypothetical protein
MGSTAENGKAVFDLPPNENPKTLIKAETGLINYVIKVAKGAKVHKLWHWRVSSSLTGEVVD